MLFSLLASCVLIVTSTAQAGPVVPVGIDIFSCTQDGTVALTFDDGPFHYTEELLDSLADAGYSATFFINGENWGSIDEYQSTIIRAVSEGHQIASHTWSHPDLTTLNQTGVTQQMTKLEHKLLDVIGMYPTYMRTPYLSQNNSTLQALSRLNYKVINTDIDTQDWRYNTPELVGEAFNIFKAAFDQDGSIVLLHDVHANTVRNLVPLIINAIKASGRRAVTVGECLGDPWTNWYEYHRR